LRACGLHLRASTDFSQSPQQNKRETRTKQVVSEHADDKGDHARHADSAQFAALDREEADVTSYLHLFAPQDISKHRDVAGMDLEGVMVKGEGRAGSMVEKGGASADMAGGSCESGLRRGDLQMLAQPALAGLVCVAMLTCGVQAQSPDTVGRQHRNSFLPQLTAIAGVMSTGNYSIDAALQMAASHHLQGWFASSTQAYAAAAQVLCMPL